MAEEKQHLQDDLSQMLSSILANPTAISTLSGLLGSLSTQKAPPPEEGIHPPSAASSCSQSPPLEYLPSAPVTKPSCAEHERRQLLLALKPFLSAERAQAVERILRALELLNLLRTGSGHAK